MFDVFRRSHLCRLLVLVIVLPEVLESVYRVLSGVKVKLEGTRTRP
jgi:hypothetical protein